MIKSIRNQTWKFWIQQPVEKQNKMEEKVQIITGSVLDPDNQFGALDRKPDEAVTFHYDSLAWGRIFPNQKND